MNEIKLPAEFRSGNSINVERATISRERMIEILKEAIEEDRQARQPLHIQDNSSYKHRERTMKDEQNCRQAFDDFYHKIKAQVSYDHWCSIWRFISKRYTRDETVAWGLSQQQVLDLAKELVEGAKAMGGADDDGIESEIRLVVTMTGKIIDDDGRINDRPMLSILLDEYPEEGCYPIDPYSCKPVVKESLPNNSCENCCVW